MKKTYLSVYYENHPSGFAVLLDATPAHTPLGNPIVVPTQALAEGVAEEWRASIPSPASGRGQGEGSIHDETALTPTLSRERERESRESKANMRLTAIACIAIDFADQRRDALIEELVGYGETDLVCYRAGGIPELEVEQETLLGPVILHAKERYGLSLQVTGGLMPIPQPKRNAEIYSAVLGAMDVWQLAVTATAAKALGSLLLSLMLLEGAIGAKEAFRLSHLEEAYETRKWGPDSEKETKMEMALRDLVAAERFLQLLREKTL